jgi:hypothetical protein
MALPRLLFQLATALLAVSFAAAHAINGNGAALAARHTNFDICKPTKTVTQVQTQTTTITKTHALLTITVGTKTETKTVTLTSAATKTCPVTTSASATPTSCPTQCPPPPSCNNLGFDWAYYNNSAVNNDQTYSAFRPVTFKNVNPVYVGTTSYVGGLFREAAPIYDVDANFRSDFFGLNHHAYLYACEGGTYRIDIPYSNDAVDVWIGAEAYSGWTDANAVAKARYNQPDHIAGSATYEFDVPSGTYVPIRFFYGQAQAGGGFTFTITAPSGEVIVSNEATFSPYVVRYSCDGVTAPVLPPFGSET